ncbi:carboxypeptidase 2 [Drepanopeziza brunnea f. sp. 'multigermtubi' MB_m1]|uniref:Carboxypeptidase 2 n=1 Tax=Marssonina brunnea f. sp. multigermtubi (strain MB_m1) TaxID=1072389 RepID=K1WR89_MARBU|nr:carboxypeptidase 2 [Drepanopeziza brunnea f. sp. 'multigermtubi' MB_m1]EKD15546.1 carboxypeptidase 2 [Drepanopeziza brunnea f. sp. 'multigermtubi' MB_m1]
MSLNVIGRAMEARNFKIGDPQALPDSAADLAICPEAESIFRESIEGPCYAYSGRGTSDIRHSSDKPTPLSYFVDYLKLDSIRKALGTGDFVYPNFLEDVEILLDNDVRVALFYGDANFIRKCFVGQAVSLAVNYTYTREFAAGSPLSRHRPVAALEMFRWTLLGLGIPDGNLRVSANYSSTCIVVDYELVGVDGF